MSKSSLNTVNRSSKNIAIIKCENYDPSKVRVAVERGIDLLGGIDKFIKRNEKIILKPNLLVPASAESAVTTHPAVFRAVGEILSDAGTYLLWGDSPAVGMPAMVARQCGIFSEAAKLRAKQADFGRSEWAAFPDGLQNKGFDIARGILDSDGMISIPKMKTHGLMKITGAYKNQFGCLPGLQKGKFHLKFKNRSEFARMLIDLDRLVAPRLYIMDGIVAMEGQGPRSGERKKMNVIILGTSAWAVDTVFARLIGIKSGLVPCLTEAEKSCVDKPHEIKILGDPIEELADHSFKIDRSPVLEPAETRLKKFARNLIIKKPKMIPDRCVKCGSCVDVCPTLPKSVDFTSSAGRQAPPVFNYSTCIRCYCCHEVCPAKAIVLKSFI
jgi:uncharacterized protein (DUF362 family)/NAD-dependent dihydropyrimidine dehydrogenase PreA subunit